MARCTRILVFDSYLKPGYPLLKDGTGTASNVRFGAVSGVLTVVEVTLSVAFLAAAALSAQSTLVAGELDKTLPTREVLVASVSMADDWSVGGEWAAPDPVEFRVPADVIPPAQWYSALSLRGT